MNKKIEIVFGFLVIVIVMVGFVVAGLATVPKASDVTSARTVKKIEMPVDILKSPVFNKIKDLSVNGQLPVQLNSSELGRPNPFAPI